VKTEIFLQRGLDSKFADLPVGQIAALAEPIRKSQRPSMETANAKSGDPGFHLDVAF
jgi:hypothetical protein